MATMDDVLDFARRDPIAAFVSVPIAAQRPPRPRIIVQLKGRSLALPDWNGNEWSWYGSLAIRYADSVDKARAGIKLVEDANRRLTSLDGPMSALGTNKPTPVAAADYYFAAVKLVIAAHTASDREASGILFVDAFKFAVTHIPQSIGEALAAMLGAGGEILKPVVIEAGKILADIFEQTTGIGIGVVLIAAAAWWLWSHSKKSKEE